MIYSVRGVLTAVEPNFVVVECAGVGYGLRTTMNTIGRLPKTGVEVKLHTHLNVREDAVELFGFFERKELECFRMLSSVNGVGPKAAIAILSEFSPEKLLLCIGTGDAKAITRAPGVGPKLASRIVLELKDKISNEDLTQGVTEQPGAPALPVSGAGEALSALIALGYTQGEAASAVAGFPAEMDVQDIIKGALKKLSARR